MIFDASLESAGREVVEMFPLVRREVERALKRRYAGRPTVVLVKDGDTFRRMSGTGLVVAYALPQKDVIVIDHSKMGRAPFSLKTILKHEMCHLLLHRSRGGKDLPRWLDEGIAQWASDGIGEMLMRGNGSVLEDAVVSGKVLSVRVLSDRFPADRDALALAYEESKSIVVYIVDEFGVDGLLMILEYLERGEEVDDAVAKALSVTFEELEAGWRGRIEGGIAWFTYLAGHLYELVFVLASLITIVAFVKVIVKKRSYMGRDE